MKVAIEIGLCYVIVPIEQIESVLRILSGGLYTYAWDRKEYQRDPLAQINFRLVLEEAIVEMPQAPQTQESGA